MQKQSNYIIAIDGPTASGKGTVAKLLAKRLGIITLSTGCIYRAVCIFFMDKNISPKELDAIEREIADVQIDVKCENGETFVKINGTDVTERLEDQKTSANVAYYAKIPCVRAKVKHIQKLIAIDKSLVCEGRDITSVVFPYAKYRIFLTASATVRAERRYAQEIKHGLNTTYADVHAAIITRDYMDKTRTNSPLVRVKGVSKVDSSKLNAEETVDKILRVMKKIDRKTKTDKYIAPDDFKLPFGGNFMRKFLKTVLYIPFQIVCPNRVINRRELKKHRGRPVILACNHRTNFDVVSMFLTFPTRKFHFIGKESLFKRGTILNWGLRALNGVPIRYGKNDLAIIRHCLGILKNGDSLSIFPEGQRNFNAEDALSVQNGTAMISLKSGVPVVVMVTNKTPRPFRIVKWRIGATIDPANYKKIDDMSTAIRHEMARLLDGFEKRKKPHKWDAEPIHNVRGITFIDGKLLLVKRQRQDKTYYVFAGGHLDQGEEPRDAAVRETKEETNIDAEVVRLLYKKHMKGECCGLLEPMQSFYLLRYHSGTVSKTDAEEYTGSPADIGHNGRPRGTYEPVLVDVAELPNITLKPIEIRDQLIKDIKKYGIHLTRPTKYVK